MNADRRQELCMEAAALRNVRASDLQLGQMCRMNLSQNIFVWAAIYFAASCHVFL